MEKNGLNSRDKREATLAKLASAFRSIASSEDRSGYNAALKELSSVLFEASRDGNALHALKLERQCIAVEQYLKETDSDILDKQLSRSGEAELSLKLVQDPKTYREHVESIFPNGIRGIPRGDGMYTFVNGQISYLGVGKRYFPAQEDARTEYYAARQANLRAGLEHFQELQRKALFPEAVKLEKEIQELNLIEAPKIFVEPRKDGQTYKGEIIHVNEERGYCVQRLGSNLYVHRLDKLDVAPERGQNLKIVYARDGSTARVELLAQKNKKALHR